MSYYPSYVYNMNEDVTRENMRKYDAMQRKIYDTIYKRYPNYSELNLREQYEIREQIKEEIRA